MRLDLKRLGTLGLGLTIVACSGSDVEPVGGDAPSGGKSGSGASHSGGGDGTGAAASGGKSDSGGTNGEGATSSGGSADNSGGNGGGTAVDTCFDEVRSADESDVDCGGRSDCRRCNVNEVCSVHGDCSVGFCRSNRCTAPACNDHFQNGSETDVDCGVVCGPGRGCVEGRRCEFNDDCETLSCDDGVCVAPSCSDGSKNQDEPSPDCGGVCSADLSALTAKRCALDDPCKVANDCDSFVCTALKCVPDAAYDPTDVIDTFEDGNNNLPTNEGRKGTWYQFHDSAGTNQAFGVEPIPGTRGAASQNALHTSGSGYVSWGAGIGVDLNTNGSMKNPYDASAYVGVTFWARTATTAPSGKAIKVLFPDGNSVYDVAGGLTACQDIPTVGATNNNCEKHLGVPISLTTAWQKYTVHFADVVSDGGYTTTLATAQMVSIQFLTATSATFDFWIDDLVFIPAPTP